MRGDMYQSFNSLYSLNLILIFIFTDFVSFLNAIFVYYLLLSLSGHRLCAHISFFYSNNKIGNRLNVLTYFLSGQEKPLTVTKILKYELG
jgi:hypothetical protein